eukprot:TRINITY_DN21273_c0_g1_i2.p1 TRINITY_DN21273_c0_g1~~TRINITY_DN21273_c0_g1_i2.p1  ORF type:complete len:620 (+),score=28.51 TRINITY_DN21273_c0_g1_i2:112-1860(+)
MLAAGAVLGVAAALLQRSKWTAAAERTAVLPAQRVVLQNSTVIAAVQPPLPHASLQPPPPRVLLPGPETARSAAAVLAPKLPVIGAGRVAVQSTADWAAVRRQRGGQVGVRARGRWRAEGGGDDDFETAAIANVSAALLLWARSNTESGLPEVGAADTLRAVPSTPPSGRWRSRMTPQAAPCVAELTSVCIARDRLSAAAARFRKETPPWIRPAKKDPQSTNPLRIRAYDKPGRWKFEICNEGDRRRVPVEVMQEQSVAPTPPAGDLILAPCWETYGYHLLLCVTGVWAASRIYNVSRDAFIAPMKAGDWTPHRFGSAKDWEDGRSWVNGAHDSLNWALWKTVTLTPDHVAPLGSYSGRCFTRAILGHVRIHDVPVAAARAFARHTLHRLNIAPHVLTCGDWRATLVDRKGTFRILNRAAVADTVSRGGFQPVRTAVWEDVKFTDQLRMASQTDLMLGIHGNGLTWVAVMPPLGVLIELWPDFAYNGNYRDIARRANVRYIPVNSRTPGCMRRCEHRVNVSILDEALLKARGHLQRTRCDGDWYDHDTLARAWDAHQAALAPPRKKKRKGSPSAPYIDSGST